MKTYKYVLFIFITFTITSYSQHLPLKIGNEWHYLKGPYIFNPYIAKAVDTVHINNNLYYKIECWEIDSQKVTRTTYDRIDGDSSYYRIYGDTTRLIFNFNWADGHIEVLRQSYYDSTCNDLILIKKFPANIWGTSEDKYLKSFSIACEGMQDTSWTLSAYEYVKSFGCWYAEDGGLLGAKIDGITYGNLFSIPVELISFNKHIISNSIKLTWTTATETNNYGFDILRSNLPESKGAAKIGFIKGNGTSTEKNKYEFWDKNLNDGRYKYQLIQIDFDGTRKQIAETEATLLGLNGFILYQNYPNPFNPTTKIEFYLQNESDFILEVYNIMGETVYTIKKHNAEQGKHEIVFDGKNLSSGVYSYQLRTNGFIKTKKMLLLK